MRDHNNVMAEKFCLERLSESEPPATNGARNAYLDVVPFAKRLVEEFHNWVHWGDRVSNMP